MFSQGERVFLPGGSGEPPGMAAQLLSTVGVDVLTTFLPGVNRLQTSWAPGATLSGPFAYPGTPYRHLPMSYAALARRLGGSCQLDTVIAQVSSPDRAGRCSLGPSVEFLPIVFERQVRRIAVINAAVPHFACAPSVALSDFDVVLEREQALPIYDIGPSDAVAEAIAGHISPLIRDGATLQVGLGKNPNSLLRHLVGHRRIRIYSGMMSDGVQALVSAGAIDREFDNVTTAFLGSSDLYAWAAEQTVVRLRGCEVTHDPRRLAGLEGLVAVNSALEVDLLGQCNLEVAGGRQVSGSGGAPDFARAARLSRGGLSIVALPSTFGRDGGSRIVVRLGSASVVTLARADVDVVATEHGAAHLRDRSVHARAEALIAIAAPTRRSALQDQWREAAVALGI